MNSANLGKLIHVNHQSMNCVNLKTVFHMCLAGASWSLTQEATSSNPFTVMTNILVTEFSEFNEII